MCPCQYLWYRDCVPGPALLTAAPSERSVGRYVRLSSMRELARLPGFLLAELLGRLVASALVALLARLGLRPADAPRPLCFAGGGHGKLMAGDLWGLDGHPEVVCLSHG